MVSEFVRLTIKEMFMSSQAGKAGENLLGPYFVPRLMTVAECCDLLRNSFAQLLQDGGSAVWVSYVVHAWWCFSTFSSVVYELFYSIFTEQWKGWVGPAAWHVRSPDFNPLYFYIWGYLKFAVFAAVFSDVQDL
jgi:hypothetical protein